MVSLTDVLSVANVISLQVIYKIKGLDNHELEMKALIAPHGNKDSKCFELCNDCLMCSLASACILISSAALQKWQLTKKRC